MSLWTSCQIFLYRKLSQGNIINYLQQPWKNHHLKPVESINQSLPLTKLYANLQDPSDSFHATVYIACQSIKIRCVFLKIPAYPCHYPRSTTTYYLLETSPQHVFPDSFIGLSKPLRPCSTCLMN